MSVFVQPGVGTVQRSEIAFGQQRSLFGLLSTSIVFLTKVRVAKKKQQEALNLMNLPFTVLSNGETLILKDDELTVN